MDSSAREALSWQVSLANSAHQREVADLKAAGLNPVLSAKYGGALTPAVSAAGVGSYSSGSGSGIIGQTTTHDGFLGGLIDSLNPNGSIKIGKVTIPNSAIVYLYEQGAQALDQLTTSVNNMLGTNVSAIDFLGVLQRSGEDNKNSTGHGYSGRVTDYESKSFNSEVSAAALGVDAGSDGYTAPRGNSAYRAAQQNESNSKVEQFLGAVNPRLLDMYWHLRGEDYKRKRAENSAR